MLALVSAARRCIGPVLKSGRHGVLILGALAAGVALSPCADARPVITTFDVPGAADTYPRSIANGVIAGYYKDSNAAYHSFVRSADGTVTTFDVPNGTSTQAISINAKGAITGDYDDTSGAQRGFLRAPDGKVKTFDVPGQGNADAK